MSQAQLHLLTTHKSSLPVSHTETSVRLPVSDPRRIRLHTPAETSVSPRSLHTAQWISLFSFSLMYI